MELKKTFVLRNFKILIFFIYLFLNFNFYSNAHMKGIFTFEEEAKEKALELNCKGTHKNKDKWLPCENEKELHKFLRK